MWLCVCVIRDARLLAVTNDESREKELQSQLQVPVLYWLESSCHNTLNQGLYGDAFLTLSPALRPAFMLACCSVRAPGDVVFC